MKIGGAFNIPFQNYDFGTYFMN